MDLWAQTGCRAGEIFGLQRRDLDQEAGIAIVRRALSNGRIGSPKTGRSRAANLNHSLLDPPGGVLEALRALPSVHEAEAAVAGRDLEAGAFVFLRQDGRP